MSTQRIDTIVAVLADRIVCVEAASSVFVALKLDSHTSTALALSALCRKHPFKRGSRVLLLSSEFFTQKVRLPALQTDGLSKDELYAALVFEIEPFSNIPLAQGLAAFIEGETTAGLRSWSVLQVTRNESQTLLMSVAAAGGRLIGLAYADNASLAPLPDPELAVRLTEAALVAASSEPPFPLIRPAAKGLGLKSRELLACLAFAGACCGCLGHYLQTRRNVTALREETRRLGALAAANAQIEADNTTLKSKTAALVNTRADREAAEAASARYRAAWRTLMHGLLDSCDQTVVLQKVTGSGLFEAEIGGLSLSEKGPGDYLAKLADRLAGSGWRLASENMHTVTSLGGQGPVRFNFHARLERPGEVGRTRAQTDMPEG